MAKALQICQGVPSVGNFAGLGPNSFCMDGTSGKLYCLKQGQVYEIPTGGESGFSGAYEDLTGLPTLFSGSYLDLTNKPTLFDGAYSSLTGIPGTFTPSAHNQAISTITGLQTALDGKQVAGSYAAANHNHDAAYAALGHNHDSAYEPKNANIQQHVVQAHAPANAQKNSDILKSEIEAKLTGEITTHTHPASGGGSDPWTYRRLPADFTISTAAAGDVTNGGVLFGFTPAAGKSYTWEAVLGLRSATATVNPRCGFAWATGMTDGVCSIEQTSTATAKIMVNGNIAAPLLMAVGGVPTNSTSWPAICYGNVLAGSNPSGNCRMQLASETAGTVVRVVAAVSYFRFRELP